MPDHLSDETLTDIIDGDVPAAAVAEHLGGCAACADRLATLRAAVAAVAAAPPPPTDQERDAAVRGALDAARAAEPRRLPAPAPWMAVAAVVVVLLGVAGVVVASRHSGSSSNTALRGAGDKAVTGSSASGAAGGPVDAGDLGDQRDAATLHTLLEAHLPAGAGTASGAAGGAAAGQGSQDAGSPQPALAPTVADQQREAAARPAATACLSEAQAAGSGRLGPLLLSGRLRWRGQPAVVLVFASPGQSQLGRRAFVMAQRGCQLLVAQSF
ncbi:MAG: hypothetical protein QOE35_81 [Actinomycetota bacterium]|jgi:hypothetical protein